MVRRVGIVALAGVLSACGTTGTARAPAHSVVVVEESYDIPPGHMPPPGQCRAWYPGEPPGHQPPPGDCNRLMRAAPSGAWVLYRPSQERRVVRID